MFQSSTDEINFQTFLRTREDFLKELNSNPDFRQFFDNFQEQYSEAESYFASLLKEGENFDGWLVQKEYEK